MGPGTDVHAQRREGIRLALVGAVFVGLGVFVIVIGNPLMGIIGITLFGACALIGVVRAVRPGHGLPPSVAVVTCLGFSCAGALLIIGDVLEIPFLGHRQAAAMPVGVITLGFFGTGTLLLVVYRLRRRSRRPR